MKKLILIPFVVLTIGLNTGCNTTKSLSQIVQDVANVVPAAVHDGRQIYENLHEAVTSTNTPAK